MVNGILEVRYPRAHKYWDASGALVQALEDGIPGLKCLTLGPEGFEFKAPGTGTAASTFYWEHLRIQVDPLAPRADGGFEAFAKRFWKTVMEGLGLSELTRVGHRYGYLFPTPEGTELLSELKVWDLSERLASFGTVDNKGVVLRTHLGNPERRLRLEFGDGRAVVGGKHRPGVLIDIDIFVDRDLTASTFDLGQFLSWNLHFIKANLHKVLRTRL